jgi:lipopolysaccharide transport system ATP-binding protein
MREAETLVKVDNVSKKFCRGLKRSLWYGLKDLGNELLGRSHGGDGQLRKDEFWAVRDVSFELRRGECLGLIGGNGAGKTTLLRMLNGLIKPDRGRIEMRGRVGALIALGAGFNPVLTGRENVYINASILGFTNSEIDRKFDDIVDFAELSEFIDSPVRHYSSGMRVRLGFSIAANFKPDILLIDEALAVGDMAFTIRCLNRIAELRSEGVAVIFVSHNELQVRQAAQCCLLLDHGHGTFYGALDQAFLAYDSLRANANFGRKSDAGFVYNGPVRIVVDGISAGAGGTLRTGGEMTLDLNCQSQSPYTDAEFELRFWNASEQLITTIRSHSSGFCFDLPRGESRMRAEIKSLPLAPGRYRIAGGVRRNGELLGWSRDLAHIEISPPPDGWIGEGMVMFQGEIQGPVTL